MRITKSWESLFDGDIRLSITDSKKIMAALQSAVVRHEAETYSLFRRVCPDCHTFRPVKDYTTRRVRTVFGTVKVRNPRWMLCRDCHPGMDGAFAPLNDICPDRATPELMELTARLGSMMPYRQAARVLAEFLPIEPTETHATVRKRTIRVGERLDGAEIPKRLPRAMPKPTTHIIDWFHIAMNIQLMQQIADHMARSRSGLAEALPAIARLHSLGSQLLTYVRSNRGAIVNYGKRYQAGLRVATTLAESAVNSLVGKRMVKKQQMRWSLHGAHMLMQVRDSRSQLRASRSIARTVPTARTERTTPVQAQTATPTRRLTPEKLPVSPTA